MKVAAIACLATHQEFLPLILEQANAKNKLVRAAALEALAEHDRPEVTKLFSDLLKGKSLEVLAAPFHRMRSRHVVDALLEQGKAVFDQLLKGDNEQIPRYWQILDCLKQRPDAEEFLLACFDSIGRLSKLKATKNSTLAGADVVSRLAWLLCGIGSPRSLRSILDQRNVLPSGAFALVLQSALLTWPPEKVYDEFAPLLDQKKGIGKEKSEEIQRAILASSRGALSYLSEVYDEEVSARTQALQKVQWDPRWLDTAIKADQLVTACFLARPGHPRVAKYLLKALEAKGQPQSGLIVEALARCQYSKLSDVFLDLVARKTKRAKYYDYELQLLFESARHLPPADLPKLDAFASKLDEKFVDKYLEALEPLRLANKAP